MVSAWGIKVIVVVILMLVVVLWASVAYPSTISQVSRAFVDIFVDSPLEEQITEKEAIKRLDILTNIYSDCIKSKETDCVCVKEGFTDKDKFPRFSAEHYIKLESTSPDKTAFLLYDKDKDVIASKELNAPLKYIYAATMTGTLGMSSLTHSELDLFNEDIKIDFDNPNHVGIEHRSTDVLLDEIPFAYKTPNNKICFLTQSASYLNPTSFSFIKDDADRFKARIKSLPLCYPDKRNAVSILNDVKKYYERCQNNNCYSFVLGLPEDYTIQHKFDTISNKNTLTLFYLENEDEPVEEIIFPQPSCKTPKLETYTSGKTLVFTKLDPNQDIVCINQKA